jgi:hypothetical protein
MILPLPLGALFVALSPATKNHTVTYSKHVAPILFKHCVDCHRPGEVAPFSLLTYKDAAKRAGHLAEVSRERRMPPWLPEPGPFHFVDEKRLSDKDLAILERWVATGAPEGDPRDLPEPPKFVEGWQLGEPDFVVKMPKPFTIPAEGPDILQIFVIPVPLDPRSKRSCCAAWPATRARSWAT